MKRTEILLLAALSFGGLFVAPYAYSKSDDEAQIQTLEHGVQDAFRAKDTAAIMKFYAPGNELFVFDVIPPRQYAGYDAYQKDWQDTFASFDGPVAFEIGDLTITTAGRLAYSHSIQHVSGKMKDGSSVDLTVRVTDVYKKSGGKWLIIHEHVSVPVDLATGKADLQSKP
jgi:ketosteroid isomerase-like protein